jgi:hypothetical protein
MSETIAFPTVDCGLELRCPRCSYTDLHQGQVTVFDRNEGAEMTVVVTTVGGGSTGFRRCSSSQS